MTREYNHQGWVDLAAHQRSHYGVVINTTKPTTGVFQLNNPEHIDDEINDGVDLAWEEHIAECRHVCVKCNGSGEGMADGTTCSACNGSGTDEDGPDCHDECGPLERGTVLAGSWRRGPDGKYIPDEGAAGAEYAAIIGETAGQVVWSKWAYLAAGCSPCYPGQGDLDTPGDILTYDLPPSIWGDRRKR